MREIKFRAWDESCQRMLYDVVLIEQREGYVAPSVKSVSTSRMTSYMQYTGLKDKKDKDIYEGDIMMLGGEGYEIGEVRYIEDRFCLCNSQDPNLKRYSPLWKNAKIIGNIYENPELLEKINGKS